MDNRDANRALLNAYSNNIMRYQRLLSTHLTELERNYIKERLSVYRAAVEALVVPAESFAVTAAVSKAPWTETQNWHT